MASLSEIRSQYPQYEDMSDQDLADALHKRFYSDMPKDSFYQSVGVDAGPVTQEAPQNKPFDVLPLTETPDGSLQFDSDAGILGGVKRAASLPGQVLSGEVDPNSPEGIDRAIEMGLTFTPSTAAARATGFTRPGVTPKKPVPTTEELIATGKQGFDDIREMGVDYSTDAAKRAMDELRVKLDQRGLDADTAPKTFKTLSGFDNPPPGSTVPITGLHKAQQKLNAAGKDFNNPTDQMAAGIGREAIDEFIGAADPRSVVAGPAAEAGRVLKDAKGNYAAGKNSQTINNLIEDIDLQAASNNSGSNVGNTARQKFRAFRKNKKQSAGFNEDELNRIKGLIEGTPVANVTRDVGNLLGGGGGLGRLHTALGAGGAGAALTMDPTLGIMSALGAVAVGKGSKALSNRLTKKATQKVDETRRKRSPLYQNAPDPVPGAAMSNKARDNLIRSLLVQQSQMNAPAPQMTNKQRILQILQDGV